MPIERIRITLYLFNDIPNDFLFMMLESPNRIGCTCFLVQHTRKAMETTPQIPYNPQKAPRSLLPVAKSRPKYFQLDIT